MSTVVNGGAGRSGASHPRGARIRRALIPYTFVLPVLAGIGLFLVYPLLSAIYFSFTKFNLIQAPEWVGLDNWKLLLEDQNLALAARTLMSLVVVMVPSRMLGALLTALLV